MTVVLLPILGKTEDISSLVNSVQSTEKAVLFLLIDQTAELGDAVFSPKEISEGQALIADLKEKLTEKNIECEEAIEWCQDVAHKIDCMAQLKQCNKIIIQKKSNSHFEEIANKLSQSNNYSIELV